jgi:hypothetical protein
MNIKKREFLSGSERISNSKDRLINIFFYGLYMNNEILKSKNVIPKNKRAGIVNGYRLRIGNNATLLRDAGSKVHGLVCSLTHTEVNTLYSGSGLMNYVPESVLVEINEDRIIPSLCYVLFDPPSEDEINDDYYEKLSVCLESYCLPIPNKEDI